MERQELLKAIASTNPADRKPILTLTNGDNTWLVSVPRPLDAPGKAYYHILQDPFLAGDAVEYSSWVLRIRHKHPGALGTLHAVQEWISDVESAAAPGSKPDGEPWLDVVLVTHINSDHLHQPTLRTFPPSTRVFGVEETIPLLKGMKHFDTVARVSDFVRGQAWPATPDLPPWLRVFRLRDETGPYPRIHHAVVISSSSRDDGGEAILYTPHGVRPDIVRAARSANPGARVLAMLHPVDVAGIGASKTLGVPNGLELERMLEPRYWIGTHDDTFSYSGILSYFLGSEQFTIERGLEEEAKEKGGGMRRPNYLKVGNGASQILV
ncbi:hypothetical protein Cob_v011187 [Colletotrichum orbiculare MAFF 240422]|uniref:Metallo-beta-lactamase domain-containing protein n=1 Tax=Colletotrichum orbiculare (strain 104-T / ATCC 96160 / CBS 514.97 / LARS 414 / MAFF 240422) TaxID=1213857 RepID=N4UUK8_COLOR|nr:hypothetical protein Cob_v011187 [Colletotrichum orbiculare MAFF 240422]